MKNFKIIFIILLSFITFHSIAQEKGFFISFDGNYGHNNFRYTLDNGSKSQHPLGWGTGLQLMYFWNKHWGISIGGEWFDYNGKASYTRNWKNPNLAVSDPLGGDPFNGDMTHFRTNGMVAGWAMPVPDMQSRNYELRLSLQDWVETQHSYVVNIPLMLEYQTKWGKKELVGMYFSLGAKFQIPVLQKNYKQTDGELDVRAYFPDYDLTLPQGDYWLNDHGLGKKYGSIFEGNFSMKAFNIAVAGELGFLFAFSRRVNLAVGVYCDYGLLNMRRGNAHESAKLIMPATDNNGNINPSALDNARSVGDGLRYNGFFQSHVTNRVDMLAFGVKAAFRIKLGKLSDDKKDCEELTQCYFDNLVINERMYRDSLQQVLIDSIKSAIGAPRRVEYDSISSPFYTRSTNILENPLWDPRYPMSTNNPDNPNYAYPSWYVPDYLNDPKLISAIGLGETDEGPNNPNTVARNVEKAKEIEDWVTAPVYFDLDKYSLRPSSIETVDRAVKIMKKYPKLTVSLLGHTCDLASELYNDKLSMNRAVAVRDYMIQTGIHPGRIGLLPMGKRLPSSPNDSEEHRALNRRVDVILSR
jgi:outer membrane protein OmpA-like peptidoglycan-associated protein